MTTLSKTASFPVQRLFSSAVVGATIVVVAALTAGFGYVMGLPLLAAALLLVLGGFWLFAKAEAGTLVVLFVLYSNIAVVAVRLHHVNSVVAGSFVLLLAIPLLRILVVDREQILVNKTLVLMFVYLVVLAASAIFSSNPSDSAPRIASYLLEGLVLYFLVLNTIRSKEELRKAIWAIVLAGTMLGMFSLYQRFTGRYDQSFGGLAQAQHVDQEDWRGNAVQPLVAGTIGEKDYYGEFMLMLVPLALFRLWTERSLVARMLALAATLVITGAIMLTYSRGAGLCLIFIVLSLVCFGYLKVRHLVALLVLAALLLAVAAPGFVKHMETLISGGMQASQGSARKLNDSAIRGRLTENLAALRIFLDHPVLGIGAGQAPLHIPQYGSQDAYKRLAGTRAGHNLYLEEMANTGLIGIICLMAILLTVLRDLLRTRRYWALVCPDYGATVAGFLFALGAFMCSSLFLSLAYLRYAFLLLALCGACIRIYEPPRQIFETPAESR